MVGVSNDDGHGDVSGDSQTVRKILIRFGKDENGATIVEYSFLVAMIALGILAAVRSYSDKMILVYQSLSAATSAP